MMQQVIDYERRIAKSLPGYSWTEQDLVRTEQDLVRTFSCSE